MQKTEAKSELWNRQIGSLYMKKPLVVGEGQSIDECVSLMQKNNRGSILVTDKQGNLCGTFTERDVVKIYFDKSTNTSAPVSSVMKKDAEFLTPDTTVENAIAFFVKKNVRHFPVCRSKNDPVGILPIRKLVDFLAEHFPSEVLNLPPQEGLVSAGIEGA